MTLVRDGARRCSFYGTAAGSSTEGTNAHGLHSKASIPGGTLPRARVPPSIALITAVASSVRTSVKNGSSSSTRRVWLTVRSDSTKEEVTL